jgi:hypothetical protein
MDQLLASGVAPYPGCSREELRKFRRMMELAIFRVLAWPYDHREERSVPGVLKELVKQLLERRESSSVALISTNYDIALEAELFRQLDVNHLESGRAIRRQRIGFGMPWRDVIDGTINMAPSRSSFQILKLHGSMNWLRCALCEQVYVNPKGAIEHNAFAAAKSTHNTCHCEHARLEALMVAPSLFQDARDASLSSVWRTAVETLRTARVWIFAGYSLPTEDVAIRAMLIRAFQAGQQRPSVCVAQLGGEARGRYQLLFPDCTYLEGGLEELVKQQIIAAPEDPVAIDDPR